MVMVNCKISRLPTSEKRPREIIVLNEESKVVVHKKRDKLWRLSSYRTGLVGGRWRMTNETPLVDIDNVSTTAAQP